MKVIFTKTSLTHHTLEIIRSDRTREKSTLETKTFMPHDLIHLAYETGADLQQSFWGLIANGASLAELNDKEKISSIFNNESGFTSEAAITEMVTGALTGMLTSVTTNKQAMESFENMFSAHGMPVPAHLNDKFLTNFRARYRTLFGQWNALKKGEPMTVIF